MTLINPNGFDNITEISGNHLDGKGDEDVLFVYSSSSSYSRNFPSIICQQFNNAVRIHFDFAEINEIGENSFKNCKKLQYLDLPINRISEISENAFIENVNLIEINLISNYIRNLSKNVFKNLTKLEVLGLGYNQIEELDGDIFSTLINLQILYLYNNNLNTLPAEIFKDLRNLNDLFFSGNQFTSLNTKWFENLSKLEMLGLYDNQLTDLAQNVFTSLSNLRALFLSSNNLTTIHSDSFGIHNVFTEFHFDNNMIDGFDERLIGNTNIDYMNGAYNPCILSNSTIYDTSPERIQIRAALARCFENYEEREECEDGNINNRVCYLENEGQVVRHNIEQILNENELMKSQISDLTNEIVRINEILLELTTRP